MTVGRWLRAASIAAAALALAACAQLPFGTHDSSDAAAAPGAAASGAGPTHVEYQLEVEAPDPLRAMLLNYLDLARFQNSPATVEIDAAELDRLLRAAPAQARGLLETEGYFNAEVSAERAGERGGLPLLRVKVAPGPQTVVRGVSIEATGELETAASAGNTSAKDELDSLRRDWTLRAGDPFRQASWSAAKTAAIAKLRSDGYALAGWRSTQAQVDAPDNQAELALVIDSGPLYHLGAVHIEGADRYGQGAIRELAGFGPGTPYSEKALLDYQERLQKLGLYGGVSVTLAATPDNAAAAPVEVHVKELQQHQATVGVGYGSNTGPRLSLEHTDRRFFDHDIIESDKLTWGPLNKSLQAQLTSYPMRDLWRNLLSGSLSQLKVQDQVVAGWNTRLGRSQATPDIDRLYFLELAHDRLDSSTLTRQADAISLNYQWVLRHLDNPLLPTRGWSASVQVAGGFAKGRQSVLSAPDENNRGPFSRLYSRLTWYEPLARDWYGTARLEAGQVFSRSAVGIPDALLFRAGGDDSVRGYGYRGLGPDIEGVTVSGRNLLTGSVEMAHPISPKYPAFLWAVFVDAGNAADRWQDISPALGYGAGLRWRSPVGPVKVDLAYGQRVQDLRLSLSIGVTF